MARLRPIDRRAMVKLMNGAALGTAGLCLYGPQGFGASMGTPVALTPASASQPVLVVVFLRGGADALSLVVPMGGADRKIYEAERPRSQTPNKGDNPALAIEERFGLHPAGKAFLELYQAKRLAIVHAVGSPSNNRSHFDSQLMIELGTPGRKAGPALRGWSEKERNTSRR